MRIALTYTLRQPGRAGAGAASDDDDADFEDQATIDAVAGALSSDGHSVEPIEYSTRIAADLARADVDFVFNICEGRTGRNRESIVPAIAESLGVAYSGSDPLTLGMTQDKSVAKLVAGSAGVATPRAVTVTDADQLADSGWLAGLHALQLPLFVKPNHEGCSKGIRLSSLVESEVELESQVRWVIDRYRQPALVEEFLPGRELSVGVLGNEAPQVFPVTEIVVTSETGELVPFYPFEMKGAHDKRLFCPADVDSATAESVVRDALRLFAAFGIRDYCRVDFKLDSVGAASFLEMNALPGLSPEYSLYPAAAAAAGLSYDSLVLGVLQAATGRQPRDGPS